MSPQRNSLANLLATYNPKPEPTNALCDRTLFGSPSPWWDGRSKTEWVEGYYRWVPNGLLGYRYEWVPGYWRREGL